MGTRSLTVVVDAQWETSVWKRNKQIELPEPRIKVSEIMVMYRHYDGYPKGHGQEVADFLLGGQVTNGISLGRQLRTFNGMNCLAAQVVAAFKCSGAADDLEAPFQCATIERQLDQIRLIDDYLARQIEELISKHKALATCPRLCMSPGGIYLYPSGTRDMGEEWVYTIYNSPGPRPTEKNERGYWIIPEQGELRLRVQGGDVTYFGLPGSKQTSMPVYFDGTPSEFDGAAIDSNYKADLKLGNIPNDFLMEAQTKRRKR